MCMCECVGGGGVGVYAMCFKIHAYMGFIY